jgi:hypothetical protein
VAVLLVSILAVSLAYALAAAFAGALFGSEPAARRPDAPLARLRPLDGPVLAAFGAAFGASGALLHARRLGAVPLLAGALASGLVLSALVYVLVNGFLAADEE